jgi:predicted RNase H-like nuclease (RuvC/YqgF family)
VAEVNPDLVGRDEQGKPFTVRYEAVNAVLLNEFLKEHRKGEQQDRRIEQLDATAAKQQEQIERLTVALKDQAAQSRRSAPKSKRVSQYRNSCSILRKRMVRAVDSLAAAR